MEDHMTANQQKHMLLTFQSLQQLRKQREQNQRELSLLKNSISKKIDSLQEEIEYNINEVTFDSITQSLDKPS